MPDSFNDRSPTRESSPKPARLASSKSAINDSPSAKGADAGGTDNIRANRKDLSANDSRAKSSPLRATRAAVDSFGGGTV